MSCRHPRRVATEILLAGSSAPCDPVVVVAESFTNSTEWDVIGCWSQCPGTGSHLRVLLGPQAVWRLTRRACLQRLRLEHCTWHFQTEGRTPVALTRQSPSHLGASLLATTPEPSTFGWNGCANCNENQMRESDIEKPNKRTVCNKRLLRKKTTGRDKVVFQLRFQQPYCARPRRPQKGNDPQQSLHMEQSGGANRRERHSQR